MNETNTKKIEYFIALCDDLITCKFLVAESKIARLLQALADTPPIYQLVSDCMEQFNRDREMNKAFVTDGKGRFWCNVPTEEYKIVALVFCVLADVEQKKIDFTDFIKRFFDDEDGVNCYTSFARRMILPFRELIAEAFGFPKRYTPSEQPQTLKADDDEDDDDDEDKHNDDEDLFAECSEIINEMTQQVELNEKERPQTQQFALILRSLTKAAKQKDEDTFLALAIGAREMSKGIKSVKFLMKQFSEKVEDALDDYFDDDED